jgi:hypothetical protein
MAVFSEPLMLRLEHREARQVEELAGRMQMPDASVGRLLLRVGLEAVKRDPSLILGGGPSVPVVAAPLGAVPGLQTRAGA